jgi:DNA-binding response OmpR family regulator
MQQLLMIEDDARLAQMVGEYLERSGFGVTHAMDAKAGLSLLQDPPAGHSPDLVILDLMLPDMDGPEVCRRVRALPGEAAQIPVLMLTAKGDPMDRIVGLELGADDYLPKPFELPILLSRVRGLLRRHEWFRAEAMPPASPPVASRFSFGDKSIDFEQLEVRVGEKRMALTLMEAALLRYFVQREGSAVPRKEILEKVWGVHEDTDTRAIDNFIVRLRRYIEAEPSNPRHLQTVRGVGYRFVANPK